MGIPTLGVSLLSFENLLSSLCLLTRIVAVALVVPARPRARLLWQTLFDFLFGSEFRPRTLHRLDGTRLLSLRRCIYLSRTETPENLQNGDGTSSLVCTLWPIGTCNCDWRCMSLVQ